MDITTRYITPDDFKLYFGIDLQRSLKDDANPSNKAIAFLMRIEDRMSAYIDATLHKNVDLMYPKFTEDQKKWYQKALLEQAIYIYRNGDVSVDSGLDLDRGEVISRGHIEVASLAPNARLYLIKCGLWSRKIRHYYGWGVNIYHGW